MPSVYIKTFGCQMNDYDSGKMRAQLAADGFVAAAEPSPVLKVTRTSYFAPFLSPVMM